MPASVPQALLDKIAQFHDDPRRRQASYNETEARVQYINPLFEALGWDMTNRYGRNEVKHEDRVDIRERDRLRAKAPDYGFYLDGRRRFFVEAKKPTVNLERDPSPAHQLRRYAWTAKLPLSILTDFEELAVYDTRVRLRPEDSAAVARLRFWRYGDYATAWDEIAGLFSREAVLGGSLERFAEAEGGRKGVATVDAEFLRQLDEWRDVLARAVANRNRLSQRNLNFAVQQILDRIIFLRIAEDRGIEPYGQLQNLTEGAGTYQRLFALWARADARYNSGLFHFQHERPGDTPDMVTPALTIDDRPLRDILRALYPPASPYAFEVFPADILGQVYEQFLGKVIRLTSSGRAVVEEKPEVRKAGGVYYTPTYIVDYIVRQTVGRLLEGHKPDPKGPASRLRVLDPACGSGSFLLGAYQYLLDWHLAGYNANKERWLNKRSGTLHQRADGTTVLRLAERRRILLDNLYGVDIDTQAVEVTKLSLLLKLLEGAAEQLGPQAALLGDRILPDLDRNIKCGNSLIGPDYHAGQQLSLLDETEMLRVNAFDWATEFPDVMRVGGFDAVIGNPPYIRIQALKEWAPLEVELYKKQYRAASKGNYDIYVVFVEKGLSLLNERGRLGFILPHKFFNAKYGEPLRGLIAAGQHLSQIVHFGDQQVFAGATTYTCLMFLEKRPQEEFRYIDARDLTSWQVDKVAVEGSIESKKVDEKEWNFSVQPGSSLLERLMHFPTKLGDIAFIFVGLQTSADTVFLFKQHEQLESGLHRVFSKELDGWVEVESSLLKPVVRSGSINRYVATPTALVLFPYEHVNGRMQLISEGTLKRQYPRAWSYLSANKKLLAEREHGKFKITGWHQLYPKNLSLWEQPKIMIPYMITRLAAFLDLNDWYFVNVTTGGFGLTLNTEDFSMEFVTGLLNSKLLDWFMKQVSTNFRSGYLAANKQFLVQLPIRTIDPTNPTDAARHDRMVALVQQMLDLHKRVSAEANPQMKTMLQRQIDATDRQIDQLVYELYGLTAEEIAIVEGQSATG